MRVLVVDDEVKNAELTALALQDAGHETAFVNGSLAALKRMEAERFEAVVTDLRMAPPDGLALLEEIKRRWPEITVLLMTAYASMETARRALKSGAYDYVNKEGGFHEELKSILEKVAGQHRLRADNERLSGTVDSLKRGLATIVGESATLRKSVELARKVSGHRLDRAAARRERHRQGSLRPRHSLLQPPRGRPVGQGQLRRACPRTCSRASSSATSAERSPGR